MPPPPLYEHVPLTDDDKEMLFTIYDSRRRFLLIVYIILFVMVLFISLNGFGNEIFLMSFKKIMTILVISNRLIFLCFLETVMMSTGLFFLFTRVLPFRHDIKSGIKEKIPYAVVKKQYFPLTNQYYLTLDDPEYLFHEIDEDIYNSVNKGDNVYLYKTINSKYVFEEDGRFTIL